MKFYHGGTSKLNFSGFGHSANTGLWFTQNKDAAISYIDPKAEDGCLVQVDIDLSKCKLITFDYNGKPWSRPPKTEGYEDCKTTDELVRSARKNGYDAVLFKNVSDMKGRKPEKFDTIKASKPSTNIVITRKDQMKIVSCLEYNQIIKESYFNY